MIIMPYKSKKDRRKYDKQYNKFRTGQLKTVRKALNNGDVGRARRALAKKPNIHIKPKPKKRRRRK